MTHQHRDTYASIVGHPPLLNYMAIADGEAGGRVKFELTEVRAHSSQARGRFGHLRVYDSDKVWHSGRMEPG